MLIPKFAALHLCLSIAGTVCLLSAYGCGGKGDTAAKKTNGSTPPANATTNDGGIKSPATQVATKVDVAAVNTAKILVRDTCMQIAAMNDDQAFDRSITGQDNAHGKIDIDAATKGLDLLATLPDGDNEFITPISKVVVAVRECFDLYRKSLEAKKPFSDGSENGPKMAKLANEHVLNVVVATDESLKQVDDSTKK